MIEFPIPDDVSRESIFKIHTRNLNVEDDLILKKFVNLTEGATGADIKAICTEAGMYAIRRDAEMIKEIDFLDAINKVMRKTKEKFVDSRLYM
jgi:proteasome regulatory subunit